MLINVCRIEPSIVSNMQTCILKNSSFPFNINSMSFEVTKNHVYFHFQSWLNIIKFLLDLLFMFPLGDRWMDLKIEYVFLFPLPSPPESEYKVKKTSLFFFSFLKTDPHFARFAFRPRNWMKKKEKRDFCQKKRRRRSKLN